MPAWAPEAWKEDVLTVGELALVILGEMLRVKLGYWMDPEAEDHVCGIGVMTY
jgi:hypothetical protein